MSWTSSSSPSKTKKTIVDYGPSGEIICKCKEPTVNFTVKKEGPNKGRVFYRCSKDQHDETKCKAFYWEDDIKEPTANQLAKFEAYHRLGDGTSPSPPSTPKASTSSGSSKRKARSQSSAIVILSDDEDEWEKADEELEAEKNRELVRQKRLDHLFEGKGRYTPSPSPSKKIKNEITNDGAEGGRFNSLSSPSSKSNPSSSSQFQDILNDPSSPFHKVQQSLFGSNSLSSPSPSSTSTPSTSQTQQHLLESPSSSSLSMNSNFDEIMTSLLNLKKESEKKDRLINTAKKRTDFLVGQVEKLKNELEIASSKARLLQEENEELRSRYE